MNNQFPEEKTNEELEKLMVSYQASRDPAIGSELVSQILPRLQMQALSFTGCEEQAKEVVQETVLRFLTSFSQYRLFGTAGVRAWVRRIALNLVLNQSRRKRLVSLPDPSSVPDQCKDHLDLIEAGDDVRRALKGIKSLPEKYSQAIYLLKVLGVSKAYLSKELGIDPQNLDQRLCRGRRILRGQLPDLNEKYGDVDSV